jgi:phage baseplate assembly protein W
MIPELNQIAIGQELEIVKYPTKTYMLDFENGRILYKIDGLEAMKQAIYKILQTERYEYEIYNWNYGVELNDLLGRAKAFVFSTLKRRITEALLMDDRIHSVEQFIFKEGPKNSLVVEFVICTNYGNINEERQVSI